MASRRSQGVEVSFGDRTLKTRALDNFDFSDVDICLMSAGGDVAREWAPRIAAQGCVVIDNSSAWRTDPDVPLVVPEVNAAAVEGFRKKGIVANPNCSTAQLVVALKPLHDAATITRVVVATYQSVSGAGKEGEEELDRQTRAVYSLQDLEPKTFQKRIAFNLIPQIDVFMEDGSTKEEWKMVVETKKILDPTIRITATCVRVPVFVSHSEAVTVELARPLSADEARALLRAAPDEEVPALPPMSHMLANTVNAVNLHAFRMEKFSGLGVPHQQVKLRHFPVFLHKDESDQARLLPADRFPDIRLWVTEEDGRVHPVSVEDAEEVYREVAEPLAVVGQEDGGEPDDEERGERVDDADGRPHGGRPSA